MYIIPQGKREVGFRRDTQAITKEQRELEQIGYVECSLDIDWEGGGGGDCK